MPVNGIWRGIDGDRRFIDLSGAFYEVPFFFGRIFHDNTGITDRGSKHYYDYEIIRDKVHHAYGRRYFCIVGLSDKSGACRSRFRKGAYRRISDKY